MPRSTLKLREPQQARSAETRKRILDAALKVFAEQGFDAASIREIGELADATHPMIKYHFGNKDKLWRAAVELMFDRLSQEVIAPSGEHATVAERIEVFVRQYVRYCAVHPEHARITIAETVRGGERLDWMVQTFVSQNHKTFIPLITEAIGQGILPRMSATSFLYAFVGMCQLPFVIAREAESALDIDITTEDMINQHTDVVFELLFRKPA